MKNPEDWALSLYDLLALCERGFPATLPDSIDAWYEATAKAYRAASNEERARMRALIPHGYSNVLLSLGDRQVDLARSSEASVHLDNALTAHSIEDFLWDPRENFRRLADIWYAYEQAGLDPAVAFGASSDHSSPNAREYFAAFVAQPAWAKVPARKS